jgi:hypothetical protein
MPKNPRRANLGGGAESHGRRQTPSRVTKGQAGYNTSVVHRETRAQDGKDHHGGGARRHGMEGEPAAARPGTGNLGVDAQAMAMAGADATNASGALERKGKDGGRHRKMKGAGPASKKKGAAVRATRTSRH